MGMQYDVKAAERTTSGTAFSGRTRVKSLAISYASGGTVVIKDGGSSGATKISWTAPAAAGSTSIIIPGEGVLFETDVYVTLSGATATVFYG